MKRAAYPMRIVPPMLGAFVLIAPPAQAAEVDPPPKSAPLPVPRRSTDPRSAEKGSLATMATLPKGRMGMSIGGGVAVLLPFYAVELGVGLGGRVDVFGRFESVLGVFHYPTLGVRWAPIALGRWKVGFGFATNYSFFGIKTDQVNLTSTFYLSAGAGISGPITPSTDLVFDVHNELDLFDVRVLSDKPEADADVHYDATIVRLGIRTRLNGDLDGYLRARVRIPVETFRYEAISLYVVPSIEVGGTWSF